jgi:hypothetical protein
MLYIHTFVICYLDSILEQNEIDKEDEDSRYDKTLWNLKYGEFSRC